LFCAIGFHATAGPILMKTQAFAGNLRLWRRGYAKNLHSDDEKHLYLRGLVSKVT
jgi:hypothetical protein